VPSFNVRLVGLGRQRLATSRDSKSDRTCQHSRSYSEPAIKRWIPQRSINVLGHLGLRLKAAEKVGIDLYSPPPFVIPSHGSFGDVPFVPPRFPDPKGLTFPEHQTLGFQVCQRLVQFQRHTAVGTCRLEVHHDGVRVRGLRHDYRLPQSS
jgi:hypothetical protein